MIDFQDANEVFSVFGVYPHEGKAEGYMIGRFMVKDGKLRVLEDHNGMLSDMLHNGPVAHNTARLKALTNSAYTKVVAETDVVQGHHIDLIPKGKEPNPLGPKPMAPPDAIQQPDLGDAPQSYVQEEGEDFTMRTPPAVFDYISTGMREPQVLEVRGEDVFMNGHKLERDAVERILYTLRTGLGKLKYRKALQ